MAGFADLVLAAQPAIADEGAKAEGTQGMDWAFELDDIRDTDGNLIDLSLTTGVCEVIDRLGGTVKVSLDYQGFTDGRWRVTAAPSDTSNLLGPTAPRASWRWSLVITDPISGKKIPWWIPAKSEFTVQRSA